MKQTLVALFATILLTTVSCDTVTSMRAPMPPKAASQGYGVATPTYDPTVVLSPWTGQPITIPADAYAGKMMTDPTTRTPKPFKVPSR